MCTMEFFILLLSKTTQHLLFCSILEPTLPCYQCLHLLFQVFFFAAQHAKKIPGDGYFCEIFFPRHAHLAHPRLAPADLECACAGADGGGGLEVGAVLAEGGAASAGD